MMWKFTTLVLILTMAVFITINRGVRKTATTDATTEAGVVDQDVSVNVHTPPVAALEKIFAMPERPATEKAHFIDAALAGEDVALKSRAENLLYSMVQSGSVAEVLAALPRAAYFSESSIGEVAKLQESLCRFQNSPGDAFGFEVIKAKFNLIIGKEQSIKSWQTLCKG